jgi:Fe2+ transport system protein B
MLYRELEKNDFYTLFNYVDKHNYLKKELLEFQYKILLLLNQKDENDNQFISPSNEDCEALRNYALNCVSQSNSKKARENRLEFFENILLNKDVSANSDMQDVLSYLTEMFGKKKTNLIEINGFQLIDVNAIS